MPVTVSVDLVNHVSHKIFRLLHKFLHQIALHLQQPRCALPDAFQIVAFNVY